ncbi:hypothetical protein NDS46_21970 [Paenibacillus thiaminolyticus]|nr:hypothetical protein [Paenibacillus thiaminolyticus]WCF06983.1 hypothetical protein NDS46_21970 [Paenibacillus thiaminolyticus]
MSPGRFLWMRLFFCAGLSGGRQNGSVERGAIWGIDGAFDLGREMGLY